jgi:hypothetical protein
MSNIKISQLPVKGANLAAADLLEVSEFTGTGYVSKSITGQEIIDAASGGGVAWGDITGTLSDQTDLQTALDAKQDLVEQEALDITSNGNNAYIQMTFFSGFASNINLTIESVAIGLFKNYSHIFTKFADINSINLATGSGITVLNYNNEYLSRFVHPSSGTYTYNVNSKVIGFLNNPISGVLNFPNLTLTQSNLGLGTCTVTANNLIACAGIGLGGTAAYSLNSLESVCGTFQFFMTPNPTFSIASNIPSLRYITTVQTNANNMTSINLDGVLYIGSVNLQPSTGANLLSTFSFADIKDLAGNFTTNTTIGLSQASVDHILVKLASLDGTGGNCFYGNRTVIVRGAAPSATGLAAKATLISRGCSVTTS